tara:strand:- start:5370 stop:5660 length:291 start_codon:yes stop_codon:yes gene_type:complete
VSDLQDIHDAFAEAVVYVRGAERLDITAIYSDVPADAFQGSGASARHISFEIRKSVLAQRPQKADVIEHSSGNWKPIDVVERLDVAAWVVSVERTT